MTITTAHITPLIALIAGVLILLVPRLLNYIVAIYLIIVGLAGLHSIHQFIRGPRLGSLTWVSHAQPVVTSTATEAPPAGARARGCGAQACAAGQAEGRGETLDRQALDQQACTEQAAGEQAG